MIRIPQIKLQPEHTREDLARAVCRELKIKETDLKSFHIIKRSIDARKKPDIKYSYTIDAEVEKEHVVLKKCKNSQIVKSAPVSYQIPSSGEEALKDRPVIVGSGPAGLFCGLLLAKCGYRPLILERGEDVDARAKTVEGFWKGSPLKQSSNVQFGEGGAGTFSDGKLNTMVKDPKGRGRYVLETFVAAGADSSILYLNKPHIGTDVLRDVVKNMRLEIQRLGGEVRFKSQLTDLYIRDGRIESICINDQETLHTEVVVLAIGHSARDTFSMLSRKPLAMSPKSFAVGLRIEHPQSMINQSQYARTDLKTLPAADYKLTKKLENGRGVYSFCMCPGGYVVNASSENGMTAVNGMSYQKRDGANANSAIVVTVTPEDYEAVDSLSGVRFQQNLEQKAYALCNGKVPLQLFEDFVKHRSSNGPGDFAPAIKGAYDFGNLRECLPKFLGDSIEQSILGFDHMIKGFARKDAILSGIESRTSSPLRITRDDFFESTIAGLYPCGEGAGYAGGITSAAMDGLKVAEAIIKKFHAF